MIDKYTIKPLYAAAEREAAFKLRYRVFVEEDGPNIPADHDRCRMEDPNDPPLYDLTFEHGVLLGAFVCGELVGAVVNCNVTSEWNAGFEQVFAFAEPALCVV